MTKRARGTARPPTTLWIPSASLDRQLLDYTAIEDRLWDARLLAWDIFGSLGHVESLLASKLLSPAEYRRIRTGLRAALAEVEGFAELVGRPAAFATGTPVFFSGGTNLPRAVFTRSGAATMSSGCGPA